MACITFASCTDKDDFGNGKFAANVGDKIVFGSSMNFESNDKQTRTVYGDKKPGENGYTEIKWYIGDHVRIYCDQTVNTENEKVASCDYVVTGDDVIGIVNGKTDYTENPFNDKDTNGNIIYDEQHSVGLEVAEGQEAMCWGSDETHQFFGVYPSPVMLNKGFAETFAALDADVYENWTDVSGILMADPRIVDNPQAIPEVTYDELRELSYSGAQVLHEGSIFPVREKNIPLNIRNTNAPNDPGTMIQEHFDGDHDPDRFITGITGKKDFTIISMSKRGMSNQVGVLRKMLTVLERHGISVDYVPNGIDNVSAVLSTEDLAPHLYAVLGEIQKECEPDTLDTHDQIAVVAAVGRKMAFRPGISGKIFAALGEAGINIRMINQGPDELNIIFGVDNKDFEAAIKVLYNSFVTK